MVTGSAPRDGPEERRWPWATRPDPSTPCSVDATRKRANGRAALEDVDADGGEPPEGDGEPDSLDDAGDVRQCTFPVEATTTKPAASTQPHARVPTAQRRSPCPLKYAAMTKAAAGNPANTSNENTSWK